MIQPNMMAVENQWPGEPQVMPITESRFPPPEVDTDNSDKKRVTIGWRASEQASKQAARQAGRLLVGWNQSHTLAD